MFIFRGRIIEISTSSTASKTYCLMILTTIPCQKFRNQST